METCRSTGLYILYLIVFPSLDLVRCVLLTCSALFIPYGLKIIQKLYLSMDPTISLWIRLKRLMSTIWPTVAFSLLLTGTYLWSALEIPIRHQIALPLGLILYSVGFWESWVDVTHYGGMFRELYQVSCAHKYF